MANDPYSFNIGVTNKDAIAGKPQYYNAGGGVGGQIGSFLGFDPTPGFNIAGTGTGAPYIAATGTKNPLGTGKDPAASVKGEYVEPTPNSGGSNNTSSTDPYAKWGGTDAYNSLVGEFGTQKDNIYGTAREAAQNAGVGLYSNILDFIQSLKSGQQALDERGVQNELALNQGRGSILDMVGRGIRSAGTFLANRNSGDSSAAEGVARAYGDIGRRDLSTIGNDYELENRNIDLAQTDLDTQRTTGLRKFDEGKTQTVNSIVADARNRLAELDSRMAAADLPTRLDLEAEKNSIKEEALALLSQYDQQLAQGANGVTPTSLADRRRTAADLATRGVAADNPFDFTAEAPAQLQNTGPFASELPLFTLKPRRQEA